MFNTLRSSITATTVLSIIIISTTLLLIASAVFESVYRESSKDDLDGLSENMASELIGYIAGDIDNFSVANTLLELEQYENVKFAAITDDNGKIIEAYVGKALTRSGQQSQFSIESLHQQYLDLPTGVSESKNEIHALKIIGEEGFELGYLLIVNDVSYNLSKSKTEIIWAVTPPMTILLILVILFSVLFQVRLLRPLNTLANFMSSLKTHGDYSRSAMVTGKREIRKLTLAFNNMLSAINKEVAQNKNHVKQLELQKTQMERLANYDALTGLPNRQFFMELLGVQLANAKREDAELAVLFFDLDGFKPVNDTFGHEIGDKLLRQLATRLKSMLRDGDVVARLGGDEFLLLLLNNPSDEVIKYVSSRLIERLSMPFFIDEWEVKIGVSIGIAKAKEAQYSGSTIIVNADLAMYESKLAGRGQFSFFSPTMVEGTRRKNLIANSITNALENDEFAMYYQPKVNTEEEVVGYEALIRWQSDELGFVSPGEFIPIAEQSGKIPQITRWVFLQVCKDVNQLTAGDKDIVVSLNLSVDDLKNSGLEKAFQAVMDTFDVDPRQIEFEITETSYLENFERANTFFSQMRRLGCRISLDDFGTGYSSLSYLTQIGIDTLKIDKQFVDRIGFSGRSGVITKTIIEMAKQLELSVCAEGIETCEQRDFLVGNGCQIMQGYLFGKPAPLAHYLSKSDIHDE